VLGLEGKSPESRLRAFSEGAVGKAGNLSLRKVGLEAAIPFGTRNNALQGGSLPRIHEANPSPETTW